MTQKMTLKYQNEDDRSYGLAGMTITAAAMGAADMISSVCLDSDDTMVSFSHEYYFSGSPSISPKASWENLLRSFQVTSAMIVANVYSRSLVRMKHDVPEDILKELRSMIIDEGRDTCSLEEDEAETVYDRSVIYSRRIFGNPRLHPAIDSFASLISRRRSLSGREIVEELEMLRLL